MSVGKILGSNFVKSAVGVVKKHPLAFTGVGVAGLITYGIATSTRKKQTEFVNRLALMNPYLNPLGCFKHAINPLDVTPGKYDSCIVKYMVDKNNERYQEYYDNLSPADRIKEFYKNGGKGVKFEAHS